MNLNLNLNLNIGNIFNLQGDDKKKKTDAEKLVKFLSVLLEYDLSYFEELKQLDIKRSKILIFKLIEYEEHISKEKNSVLTGFTNLAGGISDLASN